MFRMPLRGPLPYLLRFKVAMLDLWRNVLKTPRRAFLNLVSKTRIENSTECYHVVKLYLQGPSNGSSQLHLCLQLDSEL